MACELWRMALEYQQKAAALDNDKPPISARGALTTLGVAGG